MSQHDFDIANQTASNTRVDINNALKALGSLSSGATAPTTTYANMLFYNTGDNWLYMRNEADSAWLRFAYMDQTNGLHILDYTEIVNTAGTKVGQLGAQATSTWQAGTGTTQSIVSPANMKAAILALAPPAPPAPVVTGTLIYGPTKTVVSINTVSGVSVAAGQVVRIDYGGSGNVIFLSPNGSYPTVDYFAGFTGMAFAIVPSYIKTTSSSGNVTLFS